MGTTLRVVGTAIVLVAASGAPVVADEPRPSPPAPAPAAAPEVTPAERDAAIARGCKWLDEHIDQAQDGGSPQKQYAQAAAAWAYLLLTSSKASAPIPPRAKELDRLADALDGYEERIADLYDAAAKEGRKGKKEKKDDGAPLPPGVPPEMRGMLGGMDHAQFVWPLGTAAHFHAEAVARGWRGKESKTALGRIVRILEGAQQADGGWGHDDASKPGMGLPPIKMPLPGRESITYPKTLLAAAYCGLSGLGIAQRTLGARTAPSLAKGRGYFRTSQQSNGVWPYDPSQKSDRGGAETPGEFSEFDTISIARSGGCAYALLAAGADANDPTLAAALRALETRTALLSESHGSATLGLQYAALLYRARGAEKWAEFRSTFFRRIVAAQGADGGFDCACRHTSFGTTCDTKSEIPEMAAGTWAIGAKAYVTAVHVLILTLDREAPRAVPPLAAAGPVTPSVPTPAK